MIIALIAAVTMVVTDVLGVIMVQADARNRGWLAGIMDTAQWLVGITTMFITIDVLNGHSFSEKVLVVILVSVANLLGTKLGQMIGSRYVKDKTVEARLASLESRMGNLS